VFDLIEKHASMELSDIKDFVLNLIWRGAEEVGAVAAEIIERAERACGGNRGGYACFLQIVSAIGRCSPGAVEALVAQGIAWVMESEDAMEVREDLWCFVEYVAVQYPREVAETPRLLELLLEAGRKPGVLVAVMRVAPFLRAAVRGAVVEEAWKCPELGEEEEALPVWYDGKVVAEQFAHFLVAEGFAGEKEGMRDR
jgi:hypothetical protein